MIREKGILALTECQPDRMDKSITFGPPQKARAAVVADIAAHGPPLLVFVFLKGAFRPESWVCCTADEIVLNGKAGPMEYAQREDVAFIRSLPEPMKAWRDLTRAYGNALEDEALAEKLFRDAEKLGARTGVGDQVLPLLERLQRVSSLSWALAEQAPA